MQLIDQILGGHVPVPVQETTGGPVPSLAASMFDEIPSTLPLFRGQGTPISECRNDPKAILETLGIGWNPMKLPLLAQGTGGGFMPTPRFALWKSGHGEDGYIDTCSDAYKPHRNVELVKMMTDFASELGLTIDHAGSPNGGIQLWASAEAKVQREVAKGDFVSLRLDMSTSHMVGTATSIRASGYQLWCSNGATASRSIGAIRMTHQRSLEVRRLKADKLIGQVYKAFEAYIDRHAALYRLPASPSVRRLLFVHLFGTDEDWQSVCEHLALARQEERRVGAQMIERILVCDEQGTASRIWAEVKPGRLLMEVAAATKTQPGQGTSKGTLAHAFNGISYWNSNLRGNARPAQAALSAIHGQLRASTDHALDVLTQEYVPVMQEVYGRRG